MKEFEDTLVVIPARGGSKRIPKKNIHPIAGQPMIYWPLMELRKLFKPDSILVSTDSDDIAAAVEKVGINVPFRRPPELADDYTGTVPVVTNALEWFETNVKKVKYVLTVYPTAVMISADDIVDAFKMLLADDSCDSVMSATSFAFPIQRAVFTNANGYAELFQPQYFHSRSQDLTGAQHDAGMFYVDRVEGVRAGKLLPDSNVRLKMLHRSKVIDIDTPEDFEIAEEKLTLYKGVPDPDGWTF
ncbi:pseudaminic acid cytidylyltransferase [Thalassospira sp. MA62]|nr:pseudaminic acid cytidylyltransferase [Thalassospira sp. MA62]